MNTVANNEAEPIYHSKNNSDSSPDFKNKTGCGWLNVTNTVKVKEYIIDLSHRMAEINALAKDVTKNSDDVYVSIVNYKGVYSDSYQYSRQDWVKDENDNCYLSLHGTGNIGKPLSDTNYWFDITSIIEEIKEKINTYFDSEDLIDYQVINMSFDDPDGYRKNWQWITYDGLKWYVCQYDKDMSFGNFFTGRHTRTPYTGWQSTTDTLPTGLAYLYYKDEMKARWRELVDKGIFTFEHISSKLIDWVNRIGEENFKKEWKKWPYSPCNRDSKIDFENWIFTGNHTSTPQPESLWDASTNYEAGSYVYFGTTDDINYEFMLFKAIKANQNKPPITEEYPVFPKLMGYRDSIWRYFNFLKENLRLKNNTINS